VTYPIEIDQRPTRFSTAVVVVVALGTTWLLADAVGLTPRVRYGGAGAVSLAFVLWLLASDRWRIAGAGLTGLTLPIVGLTLLAGAGYTVAAQVRDTLPPGSVFVVLGATVAVFGAATTGRDLLDRETLQRCLSSGLRTTVVVGAVLTLLALVQLGSLGGEIEALAGSTTAVLFAPSRPFPLASFLVLLGAAVYVTRAAIHALPIAAVAGGSLSDEQREGLVTIDRWLSRLALPFSIVTLAFVVLELGQTRPSSWVPETVVTTLGPAVAFEPMRTLFVLLAVTSAVAVALSRTLRTTYQRSNRELLTAIAPYCSGVALTVLVVRYHDPFLDALTGRIERQLPAQLVAPFRDILSKALSLYGSEVLALVVVTALLVVALFVVAALLLSVLFGSQTGDTAGASVAAAGLFTTATFATVLGVSLPLALVGVVTSLLLWDVGSFGATLGRELGTRATTTRTELAHGGGTLLVGVGSALLALGVETVVTDSTVGAASGVVPLVGAVVGVLLLVVASR
jgi:hypothetical protein